MWQRHALNPDLERAGYYIAGLAALVLFLQLLRSTLTKDPITRNGRPLRQVH